MAEMITFKYLREIQKTERTSAELCKLDDNFYQAVKAYVLRKKRLKDKSADMSFADKKEIENIGPVVKSIYDTRERKIVLGAIRSARTGIKIENILPEEEALLSDIKEKITNSRRDLESMLDPPDDGSSHENEVPAAKGKESGPDKKDDDAGRDIRIIEDIPEFIDENLANHGPWKSGEIVKCPEDFCEIFVKSRKAEYVN